MRAAGYCDFFSDRLVVREWCSRNLVLSLKSPSSMWVEALVPIEQFKDIVMYIPWGGTRTLPQGCAFFFSWLIFPYFYILSIPSFVVGGVQLLTCVPLFATPWTAAHQASLSFTISWSLLKLMSIELVMPSNQLILCCPLLLLPSVFPSKELESVL